LIVLIWPQIRAVEASVPATSKVATYFTDHGAEVVDMTTILKDQNPTAMIINRYDAHPSIAANQLAADALYAQIMKDVSQTASNRP